MDLGYWTCIPPVEIGCPRCAHSLTLWHSNAEYPAIWCKQLHSCRYSQQVHQFWNSQASQLHLWNIVTYIRELWQIKSRTFRHSGDNVPIMVLSWVNTLHNHNTVQLPESGVHQMVTGSLLALCKMSRYLLLVQPPHWSCGRWKGLRCWTIQQTQRWDWLWESNGMTSSHLDSDCHQQIIWWPFIGYQHNAGRIPFSQRYELTPGWCSNRR